MNSSRITESVTWTVSRFNQLDALQLYALMQLRVDVFVLEQQCIYRELDDLDTLADTLHIIGSIPGCADKVVAYARAMAPGGSLLSSSIGRVVTRKDYRGAGLAREMMQRLVAASEETWPGLGIFLSAQVNVTDLYESLGFRQISGEYLEDGIAHIDMLKPGQNAVRPENPA